MLYSSLKRILFSLPPETAHDLILDFARLSPMLGSLSGTTPDPRMTLSVGNLSWKSPVGLAAGLDKNAQALSFFSTQGFGAIECGTVTLKPQLGNPKPRLFRYAQEESLRNAMGFPNQGLLAILPRLKAYEDSTPLGVNIGKNKDSTPEESIEEMGILMETMKENADYFVINVSSPNTPGLRALQEKSYLTELFSNLSKVRGHKDLYLKIAPDLTHDKIIELTYLAHEFKLTGLIATNTTIIAERGIGGVSGKLLSQKAHEVRKIILAEKTTLELIGVGGISDFSDLLEFWNEGGKAIQVYTSYIYQGPGLLKNFQKDILKFLNFHKLPALQSFFYLPLEERQERIRIYPAYS